MFSQLNILSQLSKGVRGYGAFLITGKQSWASSGEGMRMVEFSVGVIGNDS